MSTSIEKGDIVAIKLSKDLEPVPVEVLKVVPDYEKPGNILRFDFINRDEASPFRRVGYPSEIVRIIRKCSNPAPNPLVVRAYDNPKPQGPNEIVVNGKQYIEKDNSPDRKDPSSVITPGTVTEVHPAVAAPSKPVVKRGKMDKEK